MAKKNLTIIVGDIEPGLSIEGILYDFLARQMTVFEARDEILEHLNKKMCKNCYGKGYHTQMQGVTSRGRRRDKLAIRLCTCSRGKDLAKFFTVKTKHKRLY